MVACVFIQSRLCFAALSAYLLAVVVSDTFIKKKTSCSLLLPHKWLFCHDCGFLQRLDARSSPADNGSLCVPHYDELAASGFSKGKMDGFDQHFRDGKKWIKLFQLSSSL